MSSGSQKKQTEVLGELARELRQCSGLGASFFRAAAARLEMTDTDMQVIDLLESTGEASAGILADLMGLTTGTFTGILNRLEKAGLVHRDRDPNDGRRVIVKLERDQDEMHEVSSLFASRGHAWEELASHYDDEQRAFLLEFLERSNALARQEIARLREASAGKEGMFSAPLADLESARLVFPSGAFRLTLRTTEGMAELYQARFEGPVPEVKAKDGIVTIRYPRRLLGLGGQQRAAEVTLSRAIPWQIVIQGGASEITDLPAPTGRVPMRISGGASEVIIRRPAGSAARVHIKGWVYKFVFDEQTFRAVGNDVRLQSSGFDPATPSYDIEVASSASQLTITSG